MKLNKNGRTAQKSLIGGHKENQFVDFQYPGILS